MREKRAERLAKAKAAKARAQPVNSVTGSEGAKPRGVKRPTAELSHTLSASESERTINFGKLDVDKLVDAIGSEMMFGYIDEDMKRKLAKMQDKGQLASFFENQEHAAWKTKAVDQQFAPEDPSFDPEAPSNDKLF